MHRIYGKENRKKKRMSWEPSEISQCVNVLATKADDLNVIAGIHEVEG